MKYMLTLIGEEGGWEDASPEEMTAMMDRWSQFTQEVVDAGAHIAGEGLQESSTATTIRVGEGGERLVTDGPYAETKEQVGGFYLLECENLDEAIEWAKKIPVSGGGVEVRPVMDYTQFGYQEPQARAEASS
ncbi:MAG TPA: YciI family protein [Solirubrobacterales bacterium]|nr:YciI family protein [Solirubrobacterales bacterium]